jgi:hypothetical protein
VELLAGLRVRCLAGAFFKKQHFIQENTENKPLDNFHENRLVLMHLSKNITLNLLCLSLNENVPPLVLAPMSIGCKTKLMEVNK